MTSNALLEAFKAEGHGWSAGLVEVLEDFESRLQLLGSDPERQPGNGGKEGETEGDTKSASGGLQE